MTSGLLSLLNLIKYSPQVLADLFVGGLVLGILLAVAGYFIAMRCAYSYRRHLVCSDDQYA